MYHKRMNSATVIHLDKAVERKPLIERMKEFFPALEIYSARDGTQWQADLRIQKIHPRSKEPVTLGILGCAHSHIQLIYTALLKKESSLVILEDDCAFGDVTRDEVIKYIHGSNTLGKPWDILLLGGTEYVESDATSSADYTLVGRFWGTHALILRERGMRAVLKAFHASQMKGIFLPADWLYNEAIRLDSLVCYGPTEPSRFCRQKEGIISYLTGVMRQ
jgi:GR25 family glycosyltransferase involved in LPS biosynthesis